MGKSNRDMARLCGFPTDFSGSSSLVLRFMSLGYIGNGYLHSSWANMVKPTKRVATWSLYLVSASVRIGRAEGGTSVE